MHFIPPAIPTKRYLVEGAAEAEGVGAGGVVSVVVTVVDDALVGVVVKVVFLTSVVDGLKAGADDTEALPVGAFGASLPQPTTPNNKRAAVKIRSFMCVSI